MPKFFRSFLTVGLIAAATLALAQVNVTTFHNDNLRTGLNNAETTLTPNNVNSSTFGVLFYQPVDGQIYAQPLYLNNLQMPDGKAHNVVFVCTEHNSVYAFDADTSQPALWHVSLGQSVTSTEVNADAIQPEIGITSTPVISMPGTPGNSSATPTIFVEAKSKEVQNGTTVYIHRLHALDATTGQDKIAPVVIQGTVNGTGDGTDGAGHVSFVPRDELQRSALLLLPNQSGTGATLYLAFTFHFELPPVHGWLMAYDAATLQQKAIFNTAPNYLTDTSTNWPIAGAGIWQAGDGPASDGTGIYFSTGQGAFNPSVGSYGDSIVRLDPNTLSVLDYFSPYNQSNLNNLDLDLGSGGVVLLPAEAGSAAHPNLLVQSGKEGSMYLLDRTNLGQFNSGGDKVLQEFLSASNGVWGTPAYFNQSVYFGPNMSPVRQYTLSNGQFSSGTPASQTTSTYTYPGCTPSISSNGNTNGIVWALAINVSGNPAILHAHDATNLAHELYRSDTTNGRDTLGPAVKFTTPTIANGKVFVGTANSLAVMGQGQWTALPAVSPVTGRYSGSLQVTATDSTPGAVIYYTTDGSVPNQSSTPYSGPITFNKSVTFRVRAFAPGFGPSAVNTQYLQLNVVIGTGNGLLGSYYNGNQNRTGTPTATRLDPTVNFAWNGTSPISGVGSTNWSAEWNGNLQAEDTATYTFTSSSDDGMRVTIGGVPVIDTISHSGTAYGVGTISLQAGKLYPMVVDYYQNTGDSFIQLAWSAPGMKQQVLPMTQLYTPQISKFQMQTASVVGGTGLNGYITLSSRVLASTQVLLGCGDKSVSIPASATVAANGSSASFAVATVPVDYTRTVTITGTLNGASSSATFTLRRAALKSLVLLSNSLVGGQSTSSTFTLDGPVGPAGRSITVYSNRAAILVPASVSMHPGDTQATCTVNTAQPAQTTTGLVFAASAGVTLEAQLTVQAPAQPFLTLDRYSTNGPGTVMGTITLPSSAAADTVINLSSSAPSAATVPSSVTVPQGSSLVRFALTALQVSSLKNLNITASGNGELGVAVFSVYP